MPGEHVRQKTNAQYEVFNQQADEFKQPKHGDEDDFQSPVNVHVGAKTDPVLDNAFLFHTGEVDDNERGNRQNDCGSPRACCAAQPRDKTQQVAEQNEEENRKQKRQIFFDVFFANVGNGDAVTDEHDHGFYEIEKATLDWFSAANFASVGNKDQTAKKKCDYFKPHVLGSKVDACSQYRLQTIRNGDVEGWQVDFRTEREFQY